MHAAKGNLRELINELVFKSEIKEINALGKVC